MAEFEAEAFNKLRKMLESTSVEAVPAAEDAAAKVYLRAIRAAAPTAKRWIRKTGVYSTGDLKRSIKIVQGREIKTPSVKAGTRTRRLFVGPTKKKGFYGFFIEKGWTATGPKRRQRTGRVRAHSQRGVTGGRTIAGRPWFSSAVRSADSEALHAAESAFNSKLRELDNRG